MLIIVGITARLLFPTQQFSVIQQTCLLLFLFSLSLSNPFLLLCIYFSWHYIFNVGEPHQVCIELCERIISQLLFFSIPLFIKGKKWSLYMFVSF